MSRSNVGDDAKVTKPLSFGSHKSQLIATIRGSHRDLVKLGGEDWLRLVTWIDANAPYHDGFINKRQKDSVYALSADRTWLEEVTAVHARRCAPCHEAASVSRSDWVDLDAPERTRFLAAPLAREAGGLSSCGTAVYASALDPDYRKVRELIEAAAKKALEHPRRDVAARERR